MNLKIWSNIICIVFIAIILIGCDSTSSIDSTNNIDSTTIKYEIVNSSNLLIQNSDFEALYEKSKNASLAWIDSLDEADYLSIENCSLHIFNDNSAFFLLKTIDKPNVEDDSILVSFTYNSSDKSWQREQIRYNKNEYGKKTK
jgi:hypothetical protein